MDQFRLGLNSFKKIKKHHTGSLTRAGAHGNSNYLNRKRCSPAKDILLRSARENKKRKSN